MKVSVVIPTKNRCNLLVQCLQSVLSQNFKDFEVIVVNDGSTDATADVVEGFEDGRIKYFELPDPKGIPIARNFGILQAKGEYIAIVDDDDIQLPNRFGEQVKRLDEGFDVVYGGWVCLTTGEKVNYTRKAKPFSLARLILIGKLCTHGGLMVRKSVLDKEPYNEVFKYGSDYELVVRLAIKGYKFGHIGKLLHVFRYQKDGVTKSNDGYQKNVGSIVVTNVLESMSDQQRQELFRERDRMLIEDAMEAKDLVSVIMPVYNKNIAPVLDSLAKQTYQNFEVVLVDDGSLEDYREKAHLYPFNLRYYWHKDDGYKLNSVRNAGLNLAKGQIFVFLDADMVPKSEDWLMRIITRHVLNKDILLIHGRDRVRDGKVIEYEKKTSLAQPWFNMSGGNFSIRSENVAKIGLFDSGFDGAWGLEDVDWALRASKAGIKIELGLDILSNHQEHEIGDSSKGDNKAVFEEKHGELSR